MRVVHRSAQITLAFVAILGSISSTRAQIATVTGSTSTPTPGVGHDYVKMLAETVDPASGSLSVRIAIPTPPSRGLSLPFAFTYDSNSLTMQQVAPGQVSWSYNKNLFSWGPWSNTLPQLTATLQQYLIPNTTSACYASIGYVFQDPTGGRHSLQLSAILSDPNHSPACSYTNWTNQLSGGDDYYKATLSRTGFASDPLHYGAGVGLVQVADASGTVYTFGNYNVWNCDPSGAVGGPKVIQPLSYSMPSNIEDRNGNVLNFSHPCGDPISSTFSISDTAGRTALTFQTNSVMVNQQINSVTVSGMTQPYAVSRGGTWPSTQLINLNFTQAFGNPNCHGVPQWNQFFGTAPDSSNEITAITLPNGQQYQFGYDPAYGLLNKITYPTGGYVSYTWGLNPQSATVSYTDSTGAANNCVYLYDKPAILHRYVSFDGSTVALQQDFSYSTPGATGFGWSTKQTVVTTHDLIRGTSFVTTYTYNSILTPLVPNTATPTSPFTPRADREIPVESTIVYKDTSGSTLRTVTKAWSDQYQMWCEVDTLDNGLISGALYSYGPGNVITDKKEYDFGILTSSSCPGVLPTTTTRETVTNYQSFAPTPIYPGAASILDRPSSVITYGNGTRLAETDYSYDQTAVASVSNLPAGTHDETYYTATSTAPRGNATTLIKQCFQGSQACIGGNLASTSTYDETGQTVSTTDPNGKTTQFSYADSYTVLSGGANVAYTPTANTNAFVTKITNPLSQTQNFTYDFNTGQLTLSKDQNNLVTTYLYNDSLSRPTLTTRPDGGTTTNTYNDTALTVTSSKKINASQTITTVALSDGVGHVKQTQLTSDPQGTVFTDTGYDGLGRVRTVSNPYRSGTDPTTSLGTTTYFYDALGRKCLEVPPDGTQPTGGVCPATQPANDLFTTYSGNTTTVTDQTGKSRESVTDGLGRVTDVFEDPAGLNYETDYTYDALGNLLTVNQEGGSTNSALWHTRTFTYDSLSRLLTSNNPEVGTITYKYDSDTNCSGSNTFSGLLVSKTDARGIRTCAQYDALNRQTSRNYSNGDPTVTTTYDQANCLGLAACQNIGQRTSETDAAGSEAWSYQADLANNRSVHVNQRTTNTIPKTSTYYFDLSGNVTQVVYPTSRVVNYTYDSADRPSTAADSANGITYAAGFDTSPGGTCSVDVTCYTPQGTFYALSIGETASFTGLNLTHKYNSRLQPLEFQASSTGGAAIDITYGFIDPVTHGNAGHVYSITNNLDTTRSQSFGYDSLNRITSALTASTHATSPAHCWGESFSVDAWGNLQSIGATTNSNYTGCIQESGFSKIPDGNNHLSGFSYDPSGNTSNDGVNSYIWDGESQLKSAAGVNYLYDSDGRRVAKVGSKLYWYGSGGDILAETNASGNTTAEYIFFGGKRIAMLPASGTPIYYVEDLLGTSRVTTSNTGVVCYDADFYPYGGERAYTNTCTQNKYKFEGKERDTETGNDDFGARYYSNRFGRWLSADWSSVPVAVPYANLTNPQTLNLYSMVADDPESFADLDGHGTDPTKDNCSGGGQINTCAGGMFAKDQNTQSADESGLSRQHPWVPGDGGSCYKDKCIIAQDPQQGGVKPPPTDKPPIAPPPGKGPNGEPNEWVKIPPGIDGHYEPHFKPKYPVPDSPGGSQPQVWWDAKDHWWSHENGKGDPREHFDKWGNKLNKEVVKAATKAGLYVIVARILVYAAEALASAP